MICWLLDNIIGILGIIVSGFVGYHVYFLSKKLEAKDKLTHKDAIRKNVEPLLRRIRYDGISSKIELVNIKKYFSHYPKTNKLNKDGYTYLGAELKALRFDGIEFFCAVREVYKNSNGVLSLKKEKDSVQQDYNVFEVGVIPYDWIEYVDVGGDEFSYRPQFFTKFNGIKKFPYKYLVHYKESETYQKGDPVDMKWVTIEIEK